MMAQYNYRDTDSEKKKDDSGRHHRSLQKDVVKLDLATKLLESFKHTFEDRDTVLPPLPPQ
jgi:hypothetical protein